MTHPTRWSSRKTCCLHDRRLRDGKFELEFAAFLDGCDDVLPFGKDFLAIGFKLDYQNANGDISNYYPDFFVKLSPSHLVFVETKGMEEIDVPLKMARLRQWCADVNALRPEMRHEFVYVDQAGFERYRPKSFRQVLESFRDYQE